MIAELTGEAFHRRIGRAKTLREELYPLSRLALFLKLPGLHVEVEAFEDSGRADGHIQITGFREEEFEVQLTYAGYESADALRSELLVTQGYAPGAGAISRGKRRAPIVTTIAAVDHDEHINRISAAVVEKFLKKATKLYASGTVLLVAFEEVKLFGRPAWSALFSAIERSGGMIESQFSKVYLFNGATNELHRAA